MTFTLQDKKNIISMVIHQMQDHYQILHKSVESAKEIAVNPEFKAENKYDTRGLEASYLAGAQAARLEELAGQIELFKQVHLDQMTNDKIQLYSLVTVLKEDEEQHFLVLPFQAGITIEYKSYKIKVISPSSPVGKLMMSKFLGQIVELNVNKELFEIEILEIS